MNVCSSLIDLLIKNQWSDRWRELNGFSAENVWFSDEDSGEGERRNTQTKDLQLHIIYFSISNSKSKDNKWDLMWAAFKTKCVLRKSVRHKYRRGHYKWWMSLNEKFPTHHIHRALLNLIMIILLLLHYIILLWLIYSPFLFTVYPKSLGR